MRDFVGHLWVQHSAAYEALGAYLYDDATQHPELAKLRDIWHECSLGAPWAV